MCGDAISIRLGMGPPPDHESAEDSAASGATGAPARYSKRALWGGTAAAAADADGAGGAPAARAPKLWRLSVKDPFEHAESDRPRDLGDVLSPAGAARFEAELLRAARLCASAPAADDVAAAWREVFESGDARHGAKPAAAPSEATKRGRGARARGGGRARSGGRGGAVTAAAPAEGGEARSADQGGDATIREEGALAFVHGLGSGPAAAPAEGGGAQRAGKGRGRPRSRRGRSGGGRGASGGRGRGEPPGEGS